MIGDAVIVEAGTPEEFCRASAAKPNGPSVPSGSLKSGLPLEMQPNGVSLFHYPGCDACGPVDPVVLIRNTGSQAVRIDQVNIAHPEFAVSPVVSLPTDVESMRSLAVRLQFRGDANVEAVMAVRSGDDVSEFQINGIAVPSGRLTMPDTYAWDFGQVPVGTISNPIQITIQHQRSDSSVTAIGSSPGVEAPFELVGPKAALGPLRSCDRHRLEVVFRAPPTPGPVEGVLSFESSTPEASAIYAIYLSGTAVAR